MSGRGKANKSQPNSTGRIKTRQSQSQSTSHENSFSLIEPVECCVCKTTFTEIEDKLLRCEFCDDSWKCLDCAGLNEDTYDTLQKNDDIVWLCPTCKKVKNICDVQIQKQIKTIVSEVVKQVSSKFENRFKAIENDVSTVKKDIDNKVDITTFSTLDSQMIALTKKQERTFSDMSAINKKLDDIINEPTQVESRKMNLVFSGMPEIDEFEDNDLVQRVLNMVDAKETPVHVRRLGRADSERSRPRPIKVVMRTTDGKERALENAAKLRNIEADSPFNPKRIFIGKDLTQLEREREFKKRQDRRKRIESRQVRDEQPAPL